MRFEVRLYPMMGNAANVRRLALRRALGGNVGCTRAIAALTRSSVWNISTFHAKYRPISAEPRLVVDLTRSNPCTLFTASSIGLVTVTSIWSIGATPLSTPITIRGKSVDGKTDTGIVN